MPNFGVGSITLFNGIYLSFNYSVIEVLRFIVYIKHRLKPRLVARNVRFLEMNVLCPNKQFCISIVATDNKFEDLVMLCLKKS